MLLLCFEFLFVINLICEAELVKTCGPEEFPCNDGSCVEKARWCDSKIDCDDDSDELYCFFRSSLVRNPNRCNETLFFLCDDGECIPAIGRCDGFSSCYDNSDEENCDVAENISAISADLTDLPINGHEVPSIPLTRNNSKTSGKFYDRENWMQADHAPHTNISAINKSIVSSVRVSNTSEHFSSSFTLKQTDQHKALQVNVSTVFGNVSENATNETRVKPLVPMNHQKALEFRDVLSMINASRNEQNVTINPVNFHPVRSSISPNKSLNLKLDAGHKQTIENPNSQSNVLHHSKLHADQEGSVSSQKTISKEEDLYKGYVKLRAYGFQKAKERALQWLIDSRDSDYGWGEETARGMIALKMADYSSGKPGDIQLMSKQLHLKLFSLISRNETKRIPLGDLALYINALSASCDNPKNFYGYDLVNILRHRTNDAQESSKFVTPFVYLVLCLHNASSYADLVKLRDMLSDWNITRIDSEAMISIAATCISRTPKFSTVGIGLVAARRLYRKISRRGLPANIYELALMTQALNEARINQELWNRTEAMHRIKESQNKDGSFGDILSTYYAVPTLSGRSFLWISKICPGKSGLDPVEVLKNRKEEKIDVHYELRFGNPLEMSQSLMIKVPKNTNFMDIMRTAATINPSYKFKYDMNEGTPTVYSIGGKANDAERGLYWTAYTSKNSTKDMVPFEGDIRNFIPALGERIAFWRKPMF